MADEVKRYLDYDGLAYLVERLTNRIEAVGGDGKWLPLTGGTLTGDLSVQGGLSLPLAGETADVSEEAGLLVLGVDGRVRFVTLAALSAFLSSPYYARRLVDSLDLPAEAASVERRGSIVNFSGTWVDIADIVETNGTYASFECDHPGVTVEDGEALIGSPIPEHYVGCTTENATAEDIAFTLRLTYTFGDGSSKTVEVPGRQLAAAHLTVTPSEVTFPAEGGSVEVEVDSSSAWEVTGCPDWITCEPTSGAGGVIETLTLTAGPLAASEIRSLEPLTLANADGLTAEVAVGQTGGADNPLTLESVSATRINSGGTFTAEVTVGAAVAAVDIVAKDQWANAEAGTAGVNSIICDDLGGYFTANAYGVENPHAGTERTMEFAVSTRIGTFSSAYETFHAGFALTAHDADGDEIGTLDVLVEVDT